MTPQPPISTLFPYTTLFRSRRAPGARLRSDRRSLCDRHRHGVGRRRDRKSTRLNSSHTVISYAVFCLKKKNKKSKTRNQKSIVLGLTGSIAVYTSAELASEL